jgi:pentatricopeptide repeat protein
VKWFDVNQSVDPSQTCEGTILLPLHINELQSTAPASVMLALYAFRTSELLTGSRGTVWLPVSRIHGHLFSDHAATPSHRNTHIISPNALKRDWSVRPEEHTRDTPAHSTHQLVSIVTTMFTKDTIASSSPGSPNYIPSRLRAFRSNIARRDTSAVLRLWRSLEKDNLLHVLGPSELETCSQFVINLCPTEPSSTWSGPSRAAAEELSLGLANRLSTSALRAYFTALVNINDPEGVLRLYNCFVSRMEHKNAFKEEDSCSSEGMKDELLTIPAIRVYDSPVDKQLIMFAIMAHAIRDDFPSAIQTGMHSKWNLLSVNEADAFLDSFTPSPTFRQKVLTFVRHADAARLLSHPSIFYKRLNILVATPLARSLQALYATMVEGLSENYPWATVGSESPSDGRPVPIRESIWAAFISGFLEAQRLDLAESAWDDMVRYGHKPGPGVWTVLIKGVGKLKGSGPALMLWRSMKEASVSPDRSSYHAIIQVMANARQWEDAAKLFNEFRLSSPLPSDRHNTPLYNTVISAHLANSREPDATSLLEEMLVSGPHPTVPTFNTFLTYYHSTKDMKSLSSMLKKMAAHRVSGDVATFSILLCALLRILDRGEAIRRTLAVMDQHKIKPNVATYTAIVTSLLQENDKKALETTIDILRTMEESGDPAIAPNVVTYTAILSGVHSWIGRDDRLVQDYTDLIVQKMKTRRVKFNKVTYNVLLKTCLENPSPAGAQKALQYYRQMCREKIPLTGDTWHIMLHGLARRNEWVVAHGILRDMQESGVKMTDWLENAAEEVARGYIKSRQRLATTAR